MAQITSRAELEAWLKDKPIDWAQVIAVRAALRAFPYAFIDRIRLKWVDEFGLVLIRATFISWVASNFPTNNMKVAADSASIAYQSYAAPDATFASFCAVRVVARAATALTDPVNAALYAADGAARAAFTIFAEGNAAHADRDAVWANINHDCNGFPSEGDVGSAARGLSREMLWPADEPKGWSAAHVVPNARLLAIDPAYQVWIDWYNRRIEGHDAAFDIPGDSDRTEDKAILARLADATDEDFWGKGATYVNTTLQSWIDGARERAAIDYVASGAPLNLGSDAELAARHELVSRLASVEAALAALKDQLASLTQTEHGGIGHNQPENATSLRDDEIVTLKQQVASLETLLTGVQTQLATPVPDVGQLVQDVPKLNRWGRAMCVMADMSSDKVAEGFEKEIGAAGARGLINIGKALVYTALCAFLLFFYTVWIPLLIG